MVGNIDWKLLVFLILIFNVKIVIKLFAIILIYIQRPDFKFSFHIRNSRLPLFYPLVILIGSINYLLYAKDLNSNYNLVFSLGILFWVLCILSVHQVKLAIERNSVIVIQKTILTFFAINAIISMIVFAGIVIETGFLNPYAYQGDFQKYFIGTGDYIKGLSFDSSTTNASINAFAVIYFLKKGNVIWCLVCMFILILAGSNTSNILLITTFLFLFLFNSSRIDKSLMIICTMLLVIFLVKISPQNNLYVKGMLENMFKKKPPESAATIKVLPIRDRPDSLLNIDEYKQKVALLYLDSLDKVLINRKRLFNGYHIPDSLLTNTGKPLIPISNIHTAPFQHKWDTTALQKRLISGIRSGQLYKIEPDTLQGTSRWPGKILAITQTLHFFHQHPLKIFTGTGIGNFSSKLAFRVTSLGIMGTYLNNYHYINKNFADNHLALYLYYFTKPDSVHSLINSPNSVYDQLFSEYGLFGFTGLIILYLGFFAKDYKKLTYGIPLIILLTGIFFTEYWFEQLSVIILFELFIFLNLKERIL